LALLERQGNEHSPLAVDCWFLLASIGSDQGDFTGEELTLDWILGISLFIDGCTTSNLSLSIFALEAVFQLDEFYQRHGRDAQRNALR
jgi:hypothetical protein